MQELFEKPEQYDTMLEKGIGITGNDKHFFIEGRLDLVIKCLSKMPSRILDFGCGIGDTAIKLALHYPSSQVVGSDLAVKAVEYAAQRTDLKNLRFIPDPNLEEQEPFDLVYLNCVFHHVLPIDRKYVAARLFQLTKKEGQIWVFENNPANPGTQLAMYTNPFDKGVVKLWPGEQKNLLQQAGFQVIDTQFLFYFPEWLKWFRPAERYLNHIPLGGQYGVFAQKPV